MTKEEIIYEREQHLRAAGKPTLEEIPPYTEDERRVCDYLQEIIPDVGCGADPIGFLISSHRMMREIAKRVRRKE